MVAAGIEPQVLYPSIQLGNYDSKPGQESPKPLPFVEAALMEQAGTVGGCDPATAPLVFVSINRFERKKNIALAIRALHLLRQHADFARIRLVLAGGYDHLNRENVAHVPELRALCDSLQLRHADWPGTAASQRLRALWLRKQR